METTNKEWKSWFASNESPYFAMFRCGVNNVPFEEVMEHCARLGIPIRQKDTASYDDGNWKYRMSKRTSVLNPVLHDPKTIVRTVLNSDLHQLAAWPDGWTGTDVRWFPCTENNRPMQKWGYTDSFVPTLYRYDIARSLAPCGYVGQNLYAQAFVVLDIDGEGHGAKDEQVIEFGERYANLTECWRNPQKPGSFHLYFATDRIVPIQHYPFAKLDFIGNQTNAAVYVKNKQGNGMPRLELTQKIWRSIGDYVERRRKEKQ